MAAKVQLGDRHRRRSEAERQARQGRGTDGPYVEAKEVIASFNIIQADNYDAAVAIARECPGDCNVIEIRELGGYA